MFLRWISGAAVSSVFLIASLAAQGTPPPDEVTGESNDDEIEAAVSFGYVARSKFKGDGSTGPFRKEVGGEEVSVEIEKEVSLGGDSSLSGGIEFQTRTFGTKASDNTPVPDRLQSLTFEFAYVRPVVDRWSIRLSAAPGLYTAGSGFKSDSFGVEADVIALYQVNPQLRFGFGAGADFPSKGDAEFSPRLGLEWIASEQWTVRVGFPDTEVAYTLSEEWQFALQLAGDPFGDIYYVEKDPAPSLPGKPSLRNSAVEYSDLRVGLAVRLELPKGLDLEAAAGYVINQEFSYSETGSADYTVESDEGAPYFSVSLRFDF